MPVQSLETVMDGRVMIRSTKTLKLTGSAAQYKQLTNYGNRDSSSPSVNQNAVSATINNNTISMNTKDLLLLMLRVLDNRELARYNGVPTKHDEYLNYTDMVGETNSAFNGFTKV